MNRVYIVFRDKKVFAVRSTETLAQILADKSNRSLKGKFHYEEWEVS